MNPNDVLGSGGAIAKRLPNYELRNEQLVMSDAVFRAFSQQEHLAVEAGTGVGKSFAYLVPAILKTAADEEQKENDRAVISTHTISLQEQLIDKDIPFLRSVLPFEFTAVLVKGRSNYVCLRRLNLAKQKSDVLFTDQRQHELQRVIDWSVQTEDGSKSSLNPEPDWDVWNEVCCEQGNCLGKKCPRNNDCFYVKTRRRIFNAQILIVNHAVLLSDLALKGSGGSILPVYQYLVIDEAHTIGQVAADYLGLSVTQYQIEYNLNRLYNDKTQKGLLTNRSLGMQATLAGQQLVDKCRYSAETLFHSLRDWLDERPGSNGRVRETDIVFNPFSADVRRLCEIVRDLIDRTDDPNERQELRAGRDRIKTLADDAEVWLRQSLDTESVYYLEKNTTVRGKQRVSMDAVPIDVGPILREELFNKTPSVVLTSATLATG